MEQTKQKQIIDNVFKIILMLIPIYMISTELNNDIWFLLNSGRYITEGGGFTTIEPFTIHEGFNFIFQQWAIDVLFWTLYSKIGKWALLAYVYVCYFIFYFITYKLCMLVSKGNKIISVIITFINTILMASLFFVTRPQSVTAILLVLEIYFLECYVRKGKWQYLISLPIISIVQINCHSSYWIFVFVTMLPYIADSFNIKFKGIGGQGYKKIPLFITFVVSILVGFLNPYGTSAMTYFFKSTNSADVNATVSEMESINLFDGISFTDFVTLAMLICVIVVFICVLIKRPEKFKLRYILLVLGYSILSVAAYKSLMLFIVCSMFSLAYILRDLKITNKKNKRKTNKKLVACLSVLIIILLALFPFVIEESNKKYGKESSKSDESYKAIDYIAENTNVEDVRLYIDYNNGGYSEFLGMKSYIDPRAEVFLKSFNGKEDIFSEYCKIDTGKMDYIDVQNKYNFTHYYVRKNKYLYDKLKNDSNYKVIFNGKDVAIFEVVNP